MKLKRISLAVLAVCAGLGAVVLANTWLKPSRQLQVERLTLPAVDASAAAARLAGAVRFQTISSDTDPNASDEAFKGLQAFLVQQFPRVHQQLKLEHFGAHSLMYTWAGSDAKARPLALMAHQDVVPIAPGTEAKWSVPPFEGRIQDGFIWGRGAWDDKGNLLAQLEAVEALLASGFQPRQTVYLLSGGDEEVGGLGAQEMARVLKQRGVEFEFILDEGLLVTEGVMPGLEQPAALIGVAEKGIGTWQLSVEAVPGHASMPPHHTAIGMISTALSRLEANPFPAKIDGIVKELFDTLAPEMKGANRVLLSNLWLFGPLVQQQLEKSPSSNAMLRTTTALTIVNAGNKVNVLPGHAEASVNFRLLPGDSLDTVDAHVKKVVANEAIKVQRPQDGSEPSAVSPTSAPGYQWINRTVREVFPTAVVAPGLMVAGTDARFFAELSRNIYKFSPVRARPEDLPRFHGTNERISVANYVEAIQFYQQLLRNAAKAS
ncbi:M20 family peptidase [Curvibacter sp. HBC61]|uniref:M20 family peptidase n=1 Tax=Curvibacter cyanobacteriorum TaxID=3026422 RepID=A0ABT5MVR7_9BURK|nr:M20 family peptidase [Curvibacter sp. HBC61]MDD0837551.1 M20 family peptidase [Curvibacter sp. HBC61]